MFFVFAQHVETLFLVIQDDDHFPASIGLFQLDLIPLSLQLPIEMGDTRDAAAIDILLGHVELGIALKADPAVLRVSPNSFIKKYLPHAFC